ncbi:hypothetical protein AVEN_200329-1 [Araneus ventricosus]|uniref:Uncharacterized protein n=1 Tax=Araneus ventricosus TaxID=182803 RepID=A0A4Y2GVM5_ARAVE|nr:hypothetical protein AVEN_200329-1 [Araneus ventricosus]
MRLSAYYSPDVRQLLAQSFTITPRRSISSSILSIRTLKVTPRLLHSSTLGESLATASLLPSSHPKYLPLHFPLHSTPKLTVFRIHARFWHGLLVDDRI